MLLRAWCYPVQRSAAPRLVRCYTPSTAEVFRSSYFLCRSWPLRSRASDAGVAPGTFADLMQTKPTGAPRMIHGSGGVWGRANVRGKQRERGCEATRPRVSPRRKLTFADTFTIPLDTFQLSSLPEPQSRKAPECTFALQPSRWTTRVSRLNASIGFTPLPSPSWRPYGKPESHTAS